MGLERLIDLIRRAGPVAVAFSGGVDSSLVAAAAYAAHGDKALAVTVASELCSESEVESAAALAKSIGIRHFVRRVSVLKDDAVLFNHPERCYHCKKMVLDCVKRLAKKEGARLVMDGTNTEDLFAYRPGLRALKELGVRSPLAELGFNKADVRAAAREMGLGSHDAPSRPCLATRFPYGTKLTKKAIARVREAEEFIVSLGIDVLRVRDHGELARIEVEPGLIPAVTSEPARKKIVAKLRSLGYNYVSVDLEGYRSGSMDSLIPAGRQTKDHRPGE